jgi:hypothetical protein
MVMVVLRTPSRSRVVSGSNLGQGWPETGMVFSEKGIVRSSNSPLALPPTAEPSLVLISQAPP